MTKPTQWPEVGKAHTGAVTLLGLVFVAMAVCQLATFEEFKLILYVGGLTSSTAWAIGIILAELLAAVGFFKLRISHFLRTASAVSAIAVSGFWFIFNIKLISEGLAGLLPNIGFFSSLLEISPGWWTTVMTGVLFLWVIYSLDLMRSSFSLDD